MQEIQLKHNMEDWINRETGELVQGRLDTKEDIERRIELDKVQRQIIQDENIYKRAIEIGNALDFTILYMENIKELTDELEENNLTKRTYMGHLLVLQSYIDYSGILRLNKQSKPMNRTGIGKVLGIANRANVKKFIDLMLEMEVLDYIDTPDGKGFELNKKYSLKGKAYNPKYVKSFNENIRQVYKENSASDVSFLFSLLPYVSYEDNVLAHNPYEKDARYLDVFTTRDIAEVTGVSPNTVYRILGRMTFEEEGHFKLAVFKTEKKLGLRNYVINPIVIYRKKGEPSESLVRSFRVQGK